jgi:Arc/MetJ family transcription regulator
LNGKFEKVPLREDQRRILDLKTEKLYVEESQKTEVGVRTTMILLAIMLHRKNFSLYF